MEIPGETNMRVISFLVVLGLVSLTSTQQPICTQGQFKPGNGDPKKPDLSQYLMYEVRVEANIINKNYTVDYTEYFDYTNKRAATHIVKSGGRTENIYSFSTNELYHIDRDDVAGITCTVGNLANSSRLFLFGTKAGPNQAVMSTAGGAFRFSNNTSEQWINSTSVRGIPCNLWRSCVVFPSGSTMVVDWYFSVPGWETTEYPLSQVPIRAHIKGVSTGRGPAGAQHTYEHYYDFMDFKTTIQDLTVFETREGAYCPGRKSTKPLPTPVNHFHFTAEILDLNGQQIGGIKEYYDNTMNLVRYDLTPMALSLYGPNPQTQIHDFTTGVAYIIDQYRGNCSVANISNIGFDVRNADPTHIRIRTAKEFFYFDKTSYNYEGTKVARDILCDVWITQRNDWPPNSPENPRSTWEWYFATSDYTANLPDNLTFGMPIMLEINAGFNGHYIYNIYDYDERMPKVLDYDLDIGQCFNYTDRQDFSFVLPGSFRATASSNLDNFKYAVLVAVVSAANGISRLRINNIQVDYADNDDITVTFTLLDRPPLIGDVLKPKAEPDLKTVAKLLTDAINKGTFKVTFSASSNTPPTVMKAKRNTFQATQRVIKRQYITQIKSGTTSSSGYSGGVMAGMGVALLVVFFIIGVLGMYFYYRKQGGAFLPKKFDYTDITKDVS